MRFNSLASYNNTPIFYNIKNRCFILCICLFCISSCKPKKHAANNQSITAANYLNLKYAKGFEVNYFKGYKQIIVKQAWKNAPYPISYYLLNDSQSIPKNIQAQDVIIMSPLDKVSVMSTTYLSFFKLLQAESKITAISDIDYVYDSTIQQLYQQQKIAAIGFDENRNDEKLIALQSKYIFTYGIQQPKDESKLEHLGVQRIYVSEYLEDSPMAQAEWLLFFAAFLNKEAEAKIIFDSIDTRYKALKSKASTFTNKPFVMCNLPFKGNWYIPGGNSLAAQFIKDAGANYVFQDNKETGGVNVSYEKALMMAMKADYFIHVNNCKNKKELETSYPAITALKAYNNNHMYNNNNRINSAKANDFWEAGIVQPDIILQDLMNIFHPESKQINSLYYYRKIETL